MTLYLIGIGLSDEKDISMKGLEAVQSCSKVYLEQYTSQLACSKEKLEKLYGKEVLLADRAFTEEKTGELLAEAKKNNIAFLVIGAPLAATTHVELFLEAKKQQIPVEVIENASVFTAVGITGLFLYKFGRATTIPFANENVSSPYEVLLQNRKSNLHTLFLLDIQGDKLMTAREGLDYLIKQGLGKDEQVIACGALGAKEPEIKVGKASEVNITKTLQCLIVPGELHFKEQEALQLYA